MSGNKALLDTNVIILLSKQAIDIDVLLGNYDEFYVSIITYMETYRYDFQNVQEKYIIDEFFALIEIVDVNMTIAQNVITYKQHEKKKIKLPDAIILATAKHLNANLISDDWDDFVNIDPSVTLLNIDSLRKK